MYGSAPSEVRERAQERIDLMTRACMTDDPAEYARLRAQLLKGDIVDFKAGNLIGPTEKSLEAKYRFFTQLSEQNDARIYKTYREAPALFYFAAAYSSLPLLMWALPSIASVALLNCVVRGKRLLAQAPLGRLTALASQVIVLALLVVVSIALIALPAFLVPLAVNGMGEASYPVVNVLGQSEVAVIESSVGQIVPRALAMLVLAALFARCSRARYPALCRSAPCHWGRLWRQLCSPCPWSRRISTWGRCSWTRAAGCSLPIPSRHSAPWRTSMTS